MTLVLDTGAFLAIERGDRSLVALLKVEAAQGELPKTHGGVVGQVWRGGPRQARVAAVLRATEVIPVGRGLGREAGLLLSVSRTSDVVDAALVCIAGDGDTLITSDPGDIAILATSAGADVGVITV